MIGPQVTHPSADVFKDCTLYYRWERFTSWTCPESPPPTCACGSRWSRSATACGGSSRWTNRSPRISAPSRQRWPFSKGLQHEMTDLTEERRTSIFTIVSLNTSRTTKGETEIETLSRNQVHHLIIYLRCLNETSGQRHSWSVMIIISVWFHFKNQSVLMFVFIWYKHKQTLTPYTWTAVV